jgi:hypothetical protein
MWRFQNSTFNQDPLTDAFTDFCFHQFKELVRHYKQLDDKSEWGFAQFCVQNFLNGGYRMVRYKLSPIEKAYLSDAIAYLETHAVSLWQDYEQNLDYRKELGISYIWIPRLKELYRKPPTNHWELNLVFGTLECFMVLEEKKLL